MFTTRQAAAKAAQAATTKHETYRTFPHGDGTWDFRRESKPRRYDEYVEYAQTVDFIDRIEGDNGKCVAIVTCLEAEILKADACPQDLRLEPATPELWSQKAAAMKRTVPNQTKRAASTIESPTKLVWKIADEMTNADRKDVIAACVERGVNKSTASTQYYRWNKARSA